MTSTFAIRRHLSVWLAVAVTWWAVSAAAVGQQAAAEGSNGPDSALRDYLSANGLLNRGMHELAVAEYRKFLVDHSDHAKAPLARYGLGVALFRLKRSDEALKELDAIVLTDGFPYTVEVAVMRGQLLIQAGRFADAANALGPVIKDQSQHDLADDAAALLVEAQYRAGDMKAAAESGAYFAQQWPDNALADRVAMFNALALVAVGDDAHAIPTLESLVKRSTEGPYSGRASLLLAQCLQRQDRAADAIKLYRTAMTSKDSQVSADSVIGLAGLLMEQGQAGEAAKALDQLNGGASDQPARALMLRGRVLLDQERYDQAAEAFKLAGERDAALRDGAEYWTAKCDLRAGRNREAAQRLLGAIKAYPQSSLLAEMSYDRAVALMRDRNKAAAITALGDFRKRFASHALAPEALHMQAALEHENGREQASAELCREFVNLHPDHPLSASIEFLWAENEFAAGQLADAAQRFERFVSKHAEDARASMARLRQGTALYRLEQYDEAHKALAMIADEADRNEALRASLLMLGDIAFRNEQWPQAADRLDAYLKLNSDSPGSDDALLKLSLAQARLARADDAIGGLTRLIDDHSESPHVIQAYFERGQLRADGDDGTQARADFDQVIARGPDSRFAPYALNRLAALAARDGKHEVAAALYARAAAASDDEALVGEALFQQTQSLLTAKKFDEAASGLRTFIKDHPTHDRFVIAQAHLVVALSRQGDEAAALEAFDAIDDAALAGLDADLRGSVLYERAWCLRELGKNAEAIGAYEALLKSSPRGVLAAPATLELADLLADAGKCEQSLALLGPLMDSISEATAGDTSELTLRERALYRLAACHYELKDFNRAADAGGQFIDSFPKSQLVGSAHVIAGESLFALGRFAKAGPHFRAVVDGFESDPARAACLLRLGECLASVNDWSGSQAAFAQHLKEFPQSELWFQAQFGVAWAMENQNNYAPAITGYRTITEKHSGPTAARAQFQIGECLFAQKKHEDAVRELLKVDILYAYPEWSAAALYEAGRCFEAMSKPDEARAQFAQVQSEYGDSRWAKLAAERLAAINPPKSSSDARAGG